MGHIPKPKGWIVGVSSTKKVRFLAYFPYWWRDKRGRVQRMKGSQNTQVKLWPFKKKKMSFQLENWKRKLRLSVKVGNNTEENKGPAWTVQHYVHYDPLRNVNSSFINRQLHENTKFSTRNAKFCSHLKYFVLFDYINTEKKLFSVFSSLFCFCFFLVFVFCCCCCCLKAHMHRTYIHNGNSTPQPQSLPVPFHLNSYGKYCS